MSTELIKLPFKKGAKTLRRQARTLKMVRPLCPGRECPETYGFGWWAECAHDPYMHEVTDTKGEPTGVFEPNTSQVSAEDKVSSGRGPQYNLEHGWKFPEDLGFAPMCQFYNCWESFPKFKTGHGDYCTEREAKLMALRIEGIPIECFDDKALNRQLAQISV